MTPQDAMRRLSGDDGWHAHVQSHLTRADELIGEAKARVAEHAARMNAFDKSLPPPIYAVSRDVQHNLEEGLRYLIHQRSVLAREIAYIERRKNVALGLYSNLGQS